MLCSLGESVSNVLHKDLPTVLQGSGIGTLPPMPDFCYDTDTPRRCIATVNLWYTCLLISFTALTSGISIRAMTWVNFAADKASTVRTLHDICSGQARDSYPLTRLLLTAVCLSRRSWT